MSSNLNKRLAANLRHRRGDLTQRVFARKLGISNATLARIETAEQNITLSTLTQICKRLKCDIGDLFEDISII